MRSVSKLLLVLLLNSFFVLTSFGMFQKVLEAFELPKFEQAIAKEPNKLKEISDEYGNKTANLCVLQKIAEKINEKNVVVQVPAFFAIGHSEIKKALEDDFGLTQLWEGFKTAQGDSKTLKPKAIEALKKIQENIKEFFERNEIPEAIKEELEALQHKEFADKFLMVRSTGREDSKTIANAGGNESIASVKAEVGAVWDAMRQVVMSYFSTKSLSQRLISGDDILKDPFMPVLVQVMVGESVWDEKNPPVMIYQIPVSGVMFSQEAEGNTPGVTQIQAAYGHNEGVVNSLVDVDTFYVGESKIINAVIRTKKKRIVAKKTETGYRLDQVDNFLRRAGTDDFSMQVKPSLTKELIMGLKTVADVIQKTYDYPMDIEFIVSIGVRTNRISLVQARPLVKTKTEEPSYVVREYIEAKKETQDVLWGTSIGIAGGYVRVVTSAEQVLIKDDLPQALNAYNDDQERGNIQVVIVNEMAPATSHEATTFRGYNVPVLVCSKEDTQTLETWTRDLNNMLLFDTQQAMVIRGSKEVGEQKEQGEKKIIEKGWATHPVPMEKSCFLSLFQPNSQALKTYLKKLAFKDMSWIDKKAKMDDLVIIVKTGDMQAVLQALQTILYKMFSLLSVKDKEIVLDQKFLRAFFITARQGQLKTKSGAFGTLEKYIESVLGPRETFERYVGAEKAFLEKTKLLCLYTLVACVEILASFERKASTIQVYDLAKGENKSQEQARLLRLVRLYPIKFLEALIGQKPHQIVAGYSYYELLKTYAKSIQAAERVSEAFTDTELQKALPLIQEGKYALQPELYKDWESFVNGIALVGKSDSQARKEALEQVAMLVKNLQGLGVLEIWVNTSFKKAWDANKTLSANTRSSKIIKTLMQEFENDKEIISWVQGQQYLLEMWERKIPDWQDPDDFETLLKEFANTFVKTFIIGEHADTYEQLMYAGEGENKVAELNYERLKEFSEKFSPMTTKFNGASELGKLVMLRLLNNVVDVYDKTIKGLTGSVEYKDQKDLQAKCFARMLVPYLSLMEQWAVLLEPWEKELMSFESGGKDWPIKEYLETLRRRFIAAYERSNKDDFVASVSFFVMNAMIGAKMDFNLSLPKTLEDCFTLMHQNIIATVSRFNKEYSFKEDLFPQLLRKVHDMLIKISVKDHWEFASPTRYVGIEYNYPNLKIFYNIPMRQHGGMFIIHYNVLKETEVPLSIFFTGLDLRNRMEHIASYAEMFGFLSKTFKVEKVPFVISSGREKLAEVQFTWILNKESDLDEIKKVLSFCAACTFQFLIEGSQDALFALHREKSLGEQFEVLYQKYKDESHKVSLLTLFKAVRALRDLPEKLLQNSPKLSENLAIDLIKEKNFSKALEMIFLALQHLVKHEKRYISSAKHYQKMSQTTLVEMLGELLKEKSVAKEATRRTLLLLKNYQFKKLFPFEHIMLLNYLFDSNKKYKKFVRDSVLYFIEDKKRFNRYITLVETIANVSRKFYEFYIPPFVKVAKKEDLSKIREFVSGLYSEKNIKIDLVSSLHKFLVSELVKNGQIKFAFDIVAKTFEKNPERGLELAIIFVFAEKSEVDEIEKLAFFWIEKALLAKLSDRLVVFAEGLIENKKFDFAKKLASRFMENKNFSKASDLAEKFIRQGEFEFGKEIADKVVENKEFYGVSKLSEKFIEKGQFEFGKEIADKLIENKEFYSAKDVAEKFIEKGQFEFAREIADKLIENKKFYSAKDVAEKFIRQGEFKFAKEIADKLVENKEFYYAKDVAEKFIESEQFEFAKEIADKLVENKEFYSAKDVAEKFIRQGEFKFAKEIADKLVENKEFYSAKDVAENLIEKGALKEAAAIASKMREVGDDYYVKGIEKAIEEAKEKK